MTELAPHRVYSDGYVVVPNGAVNDDRLSFRARGLLAYMLGRPPGWRFSGKRLADVTPEGRDAVLAALRELQRLGYYRATKVRAGGGKFVVITEVAERPSLLPPAPDPLTGDGFPGPGEPGPGEPGPGKAGPYVTTESHSRESAPKEVK